MALSYAIVALFVAYQRLKSYWGTKWSTTQNLRKRYPSSIQVGPKVFRSKVLCTFYDIKLNVLCVEFNVMTSGLEKGLFMERVLFTWRLLLIVQNQFFSNLPRKTIRLFILESLGAVWSKLLQGKTKILFLCIQIWMPQLESLWSPDAKNEMWKTWMSRLVVCELSIIQSTSFFYILFLQLANF